MKLRDVWAGIGRSEDELVASFGRARLVRKRNGLFEVMGGTAEDHTEAKQWVSLFLHEAAVRYQTPGR
ncbi:MAG: hypothetical protein WCR20_12600 [Verrucomicrobiota bacterium]|jgi:hypothetical protein|nr:hypothetical protein [Verrucomicrobiota bacterium]